MKKFFFIVALLIPLSVFAQGYKVGDKIEDFSLLDVKDKSKFSLSSLFSKKIVVIVFTSHNCPYTKIYEQRAKNFITEYEKKGVYFLLINPNNPANNPEESSEEMAKAAKEKDYSSPYLSDSTQAVCDKFGASKTPEVFILKSYGNHFILKYKGAIDDNPKAEGKVSARYVKEAIDALLCNQPVKITEKKATGCMIHR